jgi:hypothetical protein
MSDDEEAERRMNFLMSVIGIPTTGFVEKPSSGRKRTCRWPG